MNLTPKNYYSYYQFMSELEKNNPQWKEEIEKYVNRFYDGHGKCFLITMEDLFNSMQAKLSVKISSDLFHFLEKEFENEGEIMLCF